MSLGNTFENDLLALIFNATAIANIADNAASAPLISIQLALHTADPGEAGAQNTTEAAYTSYVRKAQARTTGGFSAPASGSTALAANADFPTGTGGGETCTFFSAGTAASSTGKIIMSGAISPSIVTGNGIIPRLTTATTFTLD
jgi:hypothetical protein